MASSGEARDSSNDRRGDPLWQPWEPPPVLRRPGNDLDFRHGTPALAAFPVARWRQSVVFDWLQETL
ncbi:hypothetical protein [Streptomyces thermocarboxydovorans]|uniref:hypothetical protein n=1 Tax=Streptomyces thermocarboxydovorans TaxID=59298 RepID=UPI0031D014FA